MQAIPQIFDEALIATRKKRFAHQFGQVDYIHDYAKTLLLDRLNEDIALEFKSSAEHAPYDALLPNSQTLDLESIDAHDLILSNLHLHHINDVPGVLARMNRKLTDKGLMMATLFGADTLFELRDSVNAAESSLRGGVSPRVHPFAEVKELGMLLQRTAYHLPVADSDMLTVTYKSARDLITDLHQMGASNALTKRPNGLMSKQLMNAIIDYYDTHYRSSDGKIVASFEIITLTGWKS